MYLLDTNTVIYFFKGLGNVANNLGKQSPKDIFVPSIVIYELELGIAKSNNPHKRKAQLDELLSYINIVNFTQKEAKVSAEIRAYLESNGTPIGAMDILIAGSAKANGLTLVIDLKEFQRVKNLELENWY